MIYRTKFNFKPANPSQRSLIREWLQKKYISEWIQGQGLQNTLNGLEKFFQYHVTGSGVGHSSKT